MYNLKEKNIYNIQLKNENLNSNAIIHIHAHFNALSALFGPVWQVAYSDLCSLTLPNFRWILLCVYWVSLLTLWLNVLACYMSAFLFFFHKCKRSSKHTVPHQETCHPIPVWFPPSSFNSSWQNYEKWRKFNAPLFCHCHFWPQRPLFIRRHIVSD